MKDPPAVTLDSAMTEADFSNKHLGVSGAIILAAVLGCKSLLDSGSLSKLTFGDGGGYIKKDECTGDSFEVGQAVVYEGKQCIVSKAVNSDGYLKVRFPVTAEVGMTEADFSGAKLGQSGAIILAAWLEHKVQHNPD
jgi:hypothetical protein